MDYERLYAFRFRRVDQGSREEVWSAIAPFIHERLGRPARVLDPAAGRGEFINAVPARERWAIDRTPFEGVAEDEGVQRVVSDVFDADLPREHFDGVLVSNFLEHLATPDAIYEFLVLLRGWMSPGGRIAILGPNYRHCARTYWDFADHFHALTHLAVEEHLFTAGFKPVESHSRFLPFSFTGRLPASARLTRMYLRTPLAWRLLGKQFLVIGERP